MDKKSIAAVFAGASVLIFGGMAEAADVKVLASAALKEAYLELVPQFERATEHKVATTWAGTVDIMKRMQAGEHQMCLLGWTGDNGDPDNFLAVLLGCNKEGKPNAQNIPKWCNEQFQKDVNSAVQITDTAEHSETASKMMPVSDRPIRVSLIPEAGRLVPGVEFIKKARASGIAFDVPMVMVTSERAINKIEEALNAAGADAYVCKPFTPEDMQVKLQKVIHKVEARKQPAQQAATGGFFSNLFS